MNDTKPAMPELPKPTKWYMPEHDQVEYTADQMRAYGAACADAARAVPQWLPIESAPKDGYFLVYEDGAIRAKFRFNGDWSSVEYPYIEIDPWKDRLVGADALRLLGPGKRLGISDECQEPTHWMPLPAAPGAAPAAQPQHIDVAYRLRIARLLAELHGEVVLSESQAAKYAGLDLVSWRHLSHSFSAGATFVEGGQEGLPQKTSRELLLEGLGYASAAPAPQAEPVNAELQPDDFELENMARSAFEEAMAFGIDVRALLKLARSVRAAALKGQAQ